jgi:hypothetical protein
MLSVLLLLLAAVSVTVSYYHHHGYPLYGYNYGYQGYPYYRYSHYRPYHHHRHFLAVAEVPECGKSALWQAGDTCALMAERFHVEEGPDGLERLNPNLLCKADPNKFVGQQMCVKHLKAGAVSKTPYCEQFHVAKAGDTCEKLTKRYPHADSLDFALFNPEVDCANLIEGEILCAKPLVAPICDLFHAVKRAGETCESVAIETKLGSSAALVSLNPDLDCSKPLDIGQLLCAKVFQVQIN